MLDTIADPTCYNYNNGSISIKAVGGTAPYSYLWSKGQTTPTASGLSAGNYSVEVLDKHLCSIKSSFYLLNPDPVVVNLDNEANICSNQVYYADAGNYGHKFYWHNKAGYESFGQVAEINKPGKYFVEVLNYNNCLGTDSITVNVSNETIESNFLLQSEAYMGDTLVMIEISWPIPETIHWSIPAELELIYEQDYEVEIVASQVGLFEIGLTTFNDICTEVTHKQLLVLPADQKPKSTLKNGNVNIIREVKVYPIPATGPFNLEITLSIEHEVVIEIMHLSGTRQFVKKFSGNKHYVLNFSNTNMADGIHTIRVTAGNEVMVKKLIITK
ncbi:MAG: T9SS type A sorting domain-containing protein [Salinivirgaceae bacterium]